MQAKQVRKSGYVPDGTVDYDPDSHHGCTVYAGTKVQQVIELLGMLQELAHLHYGDTTAGLCEASSSSAAMDQYHTTETCGCSCTTLCMSAHQGQTDWIAVLLCALCDSMPLLLLMLFHYFTACNLEEKWCDMHQLQTSSFGVALESWVEEHAGLTLSATGVAQSC